MPGRIYRLNRRIRVVTVGISLDAEGYFDKRMWAALENARAFTIAGTLILDRKSTWIVRYDADLLAAPVSRLQIQYDGSPTNVVVTALEEIEEPLRRYIRIVT